jgi:hypothetical protein
MTDDLSGIAAQLDAVVRTVPGVTELYASTPAIVSSLLQIMPGAAATALVGVSQIGDSIEITANIGVGSSQQGPQTAAAVSAAILDALAPGTDATVHVRISRIVG